MLSSMDNYSWKALAGYRLCFHRFALGVYRLWAFLLTVDMLFLNGSTVNRKPEPHVVECMLIVWFSLSLSHPASPVLLLAGGDRDRENQTIGLRGGREKTHGSSPSTSGKTNEKPSEIQTRRRQCTIVDG
jgi:hypothetical protein